MNDFDPEAWSSIFPELRKQPAEPSEPIKGLRFCRIVEADDDYALTGLGVGSGYTWTPGLNVAHCKTRKGMHSPPGRLCGCGLYACTDVMALIQTVGQGGDGVVLCAVAGRGRVQVHERGWRAQYAAIMAVCGELPGRVIRAVDGRVLRVMLRRVLDPEILAAVGARYRVPVVGLASLHEEVA